MNLLITSLISDFLDMPRPEFVRVGGSMVDRRVYDIATRTPLSCEDVAVLFDAFHQDAAMTERWIDAWLPMGRVPHRDILPATPRPQAPSRSS